MMDGGDRGVVGRGTKELSKGDTGRVPSHNTVTPILPFICSKGPVPILFKCSLISLEEL
jgi:hypothetical protein